MFSGISIATPTGTLDECSIKASNAYVVVVIEEDIRRFEVAVDNPTSMDS